MIQSQGSPVTPVNSNSTTASDPTTPWILSEEIDSGAITAYGDGEKEPLKYSVYLLTSYTVESYQYEGFMTFI